MCTMVYYVLVEHSTLFLFPKGQHPMKNFWKCNYIRLIELGLLIPVDCVGIFNTISFVWSIPDLIARYNLKYPALMLILFFPLLFFAFWFLPPVVLIIQLVRHRRDTESQQGMAVMFGVLAVCFHYVFFFPYLIQW